jgi:Zn-dependent protease
VPVEWRNLRSPRRDFAVIAAAGPISNLLLAAIVSVLLLAAGGYTGLAAGPVRYILGGAVLTNCLLAIFNLIPVPPLDGGNVATGLLPLPMARALAQLRPYGFLVLYGLMFSGVLDRYVFPIAFTIADWFLGIRTVG